MAYSYHQLNKLLIIFLIKLKAEDLLNYPHSANEKRKYIRIFDFLKLIIDLIKISLKMSKNGWMDQISAQICQKIRQTLLVDLNNPVKERLESDPSMNMSLMLDFEEFSISAKSTNCTETTLCESNMKNFESEKIENSPNKSNGLCM